MVGPVPGPARGSQRYRSMDRVIAATDFSEPAAVAVEQALEIARRLGAKLSVVYAANLAGAQPDAFEVARGELEPFRQMLVEEIENARIELDKQCRGFADVGVEAEGQVVDGPPSDAINQAAKDSGAGLVVVGTHGRVGYERIFLGSVAEKVIRQCPVDVLVARQPVKAAGFEHILVGTDFTPAADHALERAVALSAPGAVIDLVHAWKIAGPVGDFLGRISQSTTYANVAEAVIGNAENKGQERVKAFAGSGRTIKFRSFGGPPAGVLHDRIDEAEPLYDLVAVGSHDHTRSERWFIGSVAEATARSATCSVLVARAG